MTPLIADIMAEAARTEGVTVAAMKSHRVTPELIRARDATAYAATAHGRSLRLIARVMNRDHTTILAAVRREKARRGEL